MEQVDIGSRQLRLELSIRIARVLHRWRWIAYIGLLVILFVAVRMIWEGSRQILDTGLLDPWLDQLATTCGCKK